MKHRACRALLCLVLAVSLLLPMTVGALAGSTTIGTDASRPEYFEALGASGNYNPLKTPYHYDKTTGNVAYCLEHKKDSPSSSAEYTDFDASALWGQNTVTGIQAIVDHGYPNSCGGLSEEQAHYATANAIRAWMKESADVGYEFMLVDKGHVRPLSGTAAQQTWAFFLELLGYARAGDVLSGGGGTVRVSPREAVWTVDGDVLRTRIEVVSSDGYALSRSHVQVNVSGYTGGAYDVLDVTAPVSLLGQTVQLYLEAAAGAGNGVTLYWYEPASASSQSVAVVQLGGASGVGETRTVTITGPQLVSLTVIKRDGSTGEALDGAVFALADAAGNPVGLTQTGAGRYTAGGSAAQFTTSGGTAVIEGLTAGSYTLTEVSPPSPGYAAIAPETLQLTASGTVTIENVPTEITVIKQDGLKGERLAGMQFSLLDGDGERVTLTRGADGVYWPDAQGSAYFVTDENGQARILGLPQGSYAIAESVHEGYAALDASPRFELTVRADVTITNEPLTLEITKADGYTGEGMSGVGFVLKDAQGARVTLRKTADGVYVFDRTAQGDALATGADGKATVYYLPVGVYMLEEETQDGYVQTEPVQVTVAAGNGLSEPARAQVKNDPTVLILTKSDAATREPLDGATFRLVDENGAVVKLSKTSEGNYRPNPDGQEIFTTEKGEACIRYLLCGSYTVEEVSAPDGYTADMPKTVTVTDASDADHPVRVNMQDMPLALEFRKVDAESGDALDGCVFSLKDADGNVMKLKKASGGVYVPDASGKATFTTVDGKAVVVQINPGTYRVEEVSAVDGYALAEDVSITVSETSTSAAPATVTMQDEMLALRITKVDADTRQTLSGAVFSLVDEQGEVVRVAPVYGRADTCEVTPNGDETFTIPQSGSLTVLGVPTGAYLIFSHPEQKQNIRLRSLGENYSEDALRAVIAGTKHHVPRKKRSYTKPQKASLLIDIQAKLSERKGGGYRQWASVFNLKQMAKTVLYLQEHDLADYEELASKVADTSGRCDALTAKIRAAEQRMAEINTLKTHIINYAHTREIFAAYKKSGYSKRFLAEHEEEIRLHRAAKKAFNEAGLQKLPTVKSLQTEFAQLLREKKSLYAELHQVRKDRDELAIHKANVEQILGIQRTEPVKKKEQVRQ